MNRDLEDACSRVGWDNLYQRYIPALGPENERGERTARSPFAFSNDHNPSFSVNVRSGLWVDFHSRNLTGMGGGNYVQFVALMDAVIGMDNRPMYDFDSAERKIRVELGLSRPVDMGWLARGQAHLAHMDSPGHREWIGRKPWHQQIVSLLGIGWDPDRRRYMLPQCDRQGHVVNCRMYRPGGEPKMIWSQPGLSGNYLFPHCAWNDQWVILLEGEPDAVSMRSYGFNGASGTMGSGNPVPEGRWWVGKRVWVWMDADSSGAEATATAVRILTDGAEEVWVCALPPWEGMPGNADASDYIMELRRQGFDSQQIQNAISAVLQAAERVQTASAAYDSEPVQVEFSAALTTANAGTKIVFPTHILGKSSKVFALPTAVNITCPHRGHTWCRECVMNTQYNGDAHVQLDPRSQMTLKLINTEEAARNKAIYEHMHIPLKCPDPRIVVTQGVDAEIVMLGSTMAETEESTEGAQVDRRRHEGIVLVPHGTRLEENTDYRVQGFVYPLPKSQEQVLLLDGFQRQESRLHDFRIDDDSRRTLERFRPTGNVIDHLFAVAMDLQNSCTGIRGRLDLHVLMRSVWHSLLAFEFAGAVHQRGWLEALIIGDTRCGKSATFKALARLYGTGTLVDCKMQTAAGLLGAVETSLTTGERFVVAGLFPQQDGTGPVCLDEFSSSRWEGRGVMDHLSSTRAEGMVRINKAAHANFRARVRLIMMANPGMGRLMSNIGGYGCEVVTRIIHQPEDVARFDIAMAVSQEDVPFEVLNTTVPRVDPLWPVHGHRELLAWGWSRKPHQICWDKGVEGAVGQLAASMVQKYDSEIPLVEPADQRMRIAKLAVSVAAQCFSCDESGERLVVRMEHVYCAGQIFSMVYDKRSFAYDLFSHKAKIERTLLNEEEVERVLDSALKANPVVLADKLLRLHQFTERVFGTVVPMQMMELHAVMQTLSINRCIRLVRGGRDTYEFTPTFIRYLEGYIHRKGQQNAGH